MSQPTTTHSYTDTTITPDPTPTFVQTGRRMRDRKGNQGVTWEAVAIVTDKAEAERVAAMFPKAVKVKASTLSGLPSADGGRRTVMGMVTIMVDFIPDGVTGDYNETGLRRYNRFLTLSADLGFDTTWRTPGHWSLSLAEFLSEITNDARSAL